nr:hypothetical protein 38 [bacterium]
MPLNNQGHAAQALNEYLCRRMFWLALRDEAEHQGEKLTLYSPRHRHSNWMHAANVPIANICEALVHTIEVHLKSDDRFQPHSTADLVTDVNAQLIHLPNKVRSSIPLPEQPGG